MTDETTKREMTDDEIRAALKLGALNADALHARLSGRTGAKEDRTVEAYHETAKRPDRMTPEEKARADGYAAGVLGERDHTTRALTEVAALRTRLAKAEEERNAWRASADRHADADIHTQALLRTEIARVASLTAERDEALTALAVTVEQRSPCCGCAIRCGRCGNETRFVVSGDDALAAIRFQRGAHAYTARIRREALLDAAERLAEAFPAQAVTQADWMGGRHDQHDANVAWLRAEAEGK